MNFGLLDVGYLLVFGTQKLNWPCICVWVLLQFRVFSLTLSGTLKQVSRVPCHS